MAQQGFYFNVKQWLGDDAVLLMDWDCRAMHLHLMCIAWQQTPPGVLQATDAIIKKWLGKPNDDDFQTRIKPQLAHAWKITPSSWTQEGLCRAWQQMQENSELLTPKPKSRKAKVADNNITTNNLSETEKILVEENNTSTSVISQQIPTLNIRRTAINLADDLILHLDSELNPIFSPEGFNTSMLLHHFHILKCDINPEARATIWNLGVSLLGTDQFDENKVRGFLGKLITQYSETAVAAALAQLSLKSVPAADAKSYLMGILKADKRKGKGKVAL